MVVCGRRLNPIRLCGSWFYIQKLRLSHNVADSIQSASTSQRTIQVAVIGPPNSGKSLFTNQIVRAEISAVSCRMDTTQRNVTAAITEGCIQVVLMDSPGLIGIQHARNVVKQKTGKLLTDPERAMDLSEHVVVVHDATATGDYIHHRILHLLHRYPHISSSLVLNKIDLVRRRSDLLELVRILTNGKVGGEVIKSGKSHIGGLGKLGDNLTSGRGIRIHNDDEKVRDDRWQERYRKLMLKSTSKCGWTETKYLFADIRGWSNFDSVFFVSSLTGEGIDKFRQYLFDMSQPKPHPFEETTITTKNPQAICRDAIRAKLLDVLPADLAYRLQLTISEWQMEGDVLQIVCDIHCEKQRWGYYILGPGGRRITQVGKEVNQAMQNLFKQQLFIRILVKYKNKLVDPHDSSPKIMQTKKLA